MAPRILLDARKLGDGGIGVYIENLVDGLLQVRREDGADFSLSLLIPPLGRCTPDSLAALERWTGEVGCFEEAIAKYSAQEFLLLPLLRRSLLKSHNLYHSPHYTLPLRLGVPSVVTVHDTIHISQPEHSMHRAAGKVLIASAMQRANRVITVSRASTEQLRDYFPTARTSITIVPNALRIGFAPADLAASAKSSERGHLLFVGTGRPHKGFLEFLLMLNLLRQDPPSGMSDPSCVVVGERFERYADIIDRLGLTDAISFAGSCNLRTLRDLYCGASAVIVPSRIEGFGLVALEAMACGAPVVCSPTPSLREVCDDCAWYSAGFSARDYLVATRSALENEVERKRRVQKGLERAALFSRKQTALRTLDVYISILNGDSGQFASENHDTPVPLAL